MRHSGGRMGPISIRCGGGSKWITLGKLCDRKRHFGKLKSYDGDSQFCRLRTSIANAISRGSFIKPYCLGTASQRLERIGELAKI